MNFANPSQINFHSPFRKIKTGLVYFRSIVQQIQNKKTYFSCYKNNSPGIIEFKNGMKIEVEGRRSIQFMNSIFFNKMYGTSQNQKIIVDIGANKGLFSILFADQLRSTDFKMYCFEPHPKTFQILQNNIKLNNLQKNVFAFQKSVSGKNIPTKSFYIARDSFDYSVFNEYESDEEIKVNNTTLPLIFDENKIKSIDLLKLNCEGAEYEILMDTSDIYLKKIKEIRMEYHNFQLSDKVFDLEPLREFLLDRNFAVTNYLPYTPEHGIIWFKNQKFNLPKS